MAGIVSICVLLCVCVVGAGMAQHTNRAAIRISVAGGL